MAGPQLLAQPGVEGEGQKAGRRRDPILLHDNGSVVEGSPRREDAHQQIIGERGIDGHAALHIVLESHLALDDDQCPDALGGQGGSRQHDLIVGLHDRIWGEFSQQRVFADVGQGPANLSCEQHNDPDHEIGKDGGHDPLNGLQVEPEGHVIEEHQKSHSERHLNRARPADQQEDVVDQDADDENVDGRGPGEPVQVEKFDQIHGDLAGNPIIASHNWTTWRVSRTSWTRRI